MRIIWLQLFITGFRLTRNFYVRIKSEISMSVCRKLVGGAWCRRFVGEFIVRCRTVRSSAWAHQCLPFSFLFTTAYSWEEIPFFCSACRADVTIVRQFIRGNSSGDLETGKTERRLISSASVSTKCTTHNVTSSQKKRPAADWLFKPALAK